MRLLTLAYIYLCPLIVVGIGGTFQTAIHSPSACFSSKLLSKSGFDLKEIGSNEPIDFSPTGYQDSLRGIYLMEQIKLSYTNGDWDTFNKMRVEHLNLTKRTNDSLARANTLFYTAAYFNKMEKLDSAYFYYLQSLKIYRKVKDGAIKTGNTLLNIAILKKNIGDYVGSETASFQALKYLKPEGDPRKISSIYNNLGIVYNQLNDKDNSLKYHKKAKELRRKHDGMTVYYLHSLNNIGNVYKQYGDTQKAAECFEEILKHHQLVNEDIAFKATLLDNYAYTLFLQKSFTMAEKLLHQALKLRDSIQDSDGQTISAIHLAEFYATNNMAKALEFAKFAEQKSKENLNYRDYLESIALLASLYDNPEAKAHFEKYIALRDSLEMAHRQTRERFTRIQYETDLKEEENKSLKINKEKQELLIEAEKLQKYALAGGMALSLAALGVFFLVFRKNQRQKREIEKQKAKVEHLQRELHHRLKNNLAFIDFFITLAKGRFPDPAYRQKLDELQNRISSMFEVHRQLYKKDDLTSVNAKTYIATLVENVKKAYDRPNIHIEEKVAETELRADTSFPIGLIVNEFVTNSYKYAFPNGQKGTISINLKETPAAYQLQLADDGQGLPKDLDLENLNSFGMETMKLLTEEYKGTFHLNGINGLRIDITLPK